MGRKWIRWITTIMGSVGILVISGFSPNVGGLIPPSTDSSAYTICIDAGHQSKGNPVVEPIAPGSSIKKAKVASGTVGTTTKVPEYQLNLKLALKLQRLLEADGFRVIMTRTSNNVDISNVQRAQAANNAKADLSIRIHADGSLDKLKHGISVLYPASAVTKKINEKSKWMGQKIIKAVIQETGAKSLGVVPRTDLTGFNWSTVPCVLIETGFMTNRNEDKLLETSAYQNKLAEGMRKGIEEIFPHAK